MITLNDENKKNGTEVHRHEKVKNLPIRAPYIFYQRVLTKCMSNRGEVTSSRVYQLWKVVEYNHDELISAVFSFVFFPFFLFPTHYRRSCFPGSQTLLHVCSLNEINLYL